MFDHPDLPKLRRFALSIGLILFVYSIAGVELDPNQTVTPLGVPFKIRQPGLIGLGLFLASVYASARYWYFAMRAVQSPLFERRMLRKGQMPLSLAEKVQETVRIALNWNQLSFPFESNIPSDIDKLIKAVSRCQSDLNNHLSSVVYRLFPGRAILETRTGHSQLGPFVPYDLQHEQSLDEGVYLSLPDSNPASITLKIRGILFPRRWNFVEVYHDLDYTLPLWVNGIAIATFLLSLRELFHSSA